MTENTIKQAMTHELIIGSNKCIIDCTLYNNEDVKIELEDLTTKDILNMGKIQLLLKHLHLNVNLV